MDSYGELLKNTRLELNKEIDEVAREIMTTHQYIEAMENEDMSVFPSEAYYVGFLKNYCDNLHLDKNDILKLFYAKKRQEAPTPPDLWRPKKNKAIPYIIVGVVAAVLIATFFILFFAVFKVPSRLKEKNQTENESQKIHQYTFSGRAENKRLYRGDQILVPDANGEKNIVLTVNQTLGYLSIETPVGEQVIELSEERELDVNGDGGAELIIYLSDVSSLDASYGAEVRIMQKNSELNRVISNIDSNGTDLTEIPAESSKGVKRTVIHEDVRPYPFTINTSFRGSCLFRYRVDRQPYMEDYYKSGDTINITANNGFRLWMSNVNALKIQVIAGSSTYDLEVGRGGQVVVEDIKWIHDTDGKYRLILEEID